MEVSLVDLERQHTRSGGLGTAEGDLPPSQGYGAPREIAPPSQKAKSAEEQLVMSLSPRPVGEPDGAALYFERAIYQQDGPLRRQFETARLPCVGAKSARSAKNGDQIFVTLDTGI